MRKIECPRCHLRFKFNPQHVDEDGFFDCPRCDKLLTMSPQGIVKGDI